MAVQQQGGAGAGPGLREVAPRPGLQRAGNPGQRLRLGPAYQVQITAAARADGLVLQAGPASRAARQAHRQRPGARPGSAMRVVGNLALGNSAAGNPGIGNPGIGNPAIRNPAPRNPAAGNATVGSLHDTSHLQVVEQVGQRIHRGFQGCRVRCVTRQRVIGRLDGVDQVFGVYGAGDL